MTGVYASLVAPVTATARVRVVIADADPFARRTVRDALQETDGIVVAADAQNAREALELAERVAIGYSESLDGNIAQRLALEVPHRVFDALVYSKLRTALGGLGGPSALQSSRAALHERHRLGATTRRAGHTDPG